MAATPRQMEAISRHDVSMVVTAGAGTGKTFVLVEKYLNLIQDQGYRIRDILALTFTDKAAAEMKERVRETIAERLRCDPENPIWKQAHEELVIAPVMTFHSFCSQILREFAIEAGLDPGFVILDEGQALALQREAFETLIRRPPDEIHDSLIRLLAQIEKYQVHQILTILSQNTDAFEQFAEELERDPDSIINTWEVFLEEVRTPVIRQFFADPDIHDAISDFIRFCDIYTDENDRAVRYLREVCPYLHELTPDAPPDILHAAAQAFLQVRPTGKLGSKKFWDEDDLDQFRRAKKCLTDGLEYIVPYLSLYIVKGSGFTASTILFFQDLAQVAGQYFEILRNLKRQVNGVDFNDLIQLTREFLKSHQDIVARHIRPRYQYILVDEFQDTDPAQFEIITAIIGELKPGTRSLFIVGDPKQSIYLFRNADVTRFKEAQNRILSDCRGELINLDTSFRSCREVIGCVNYLFSRIFASTEKPWEFGYEPIQVCDERKKTAGSVTVLLPGKAPKGSARSETKEIEAGMVADLVHRIVSCGTFQITDRDGLIRPAGYGDIAILIERRTHLSHYTTALSRKETPFYVHGGIGFYSRQEIYDLYSVLSFLVRPYDSAALFGVLRSPYFSLSDPLLYHILHISGAKRGWSLYDKLQACAERLRTSLPLPDEEVFSCSLSDREKILRASVLLESWRRCAGREPVVELVLRIIRESGILTIYGALEQGEQQAANLTKLVGIIRGRSEGGYYSLFDLVNDLTISIADEEREGEAARDTLSKTSVNIMTVHAAKGLEFPIVILPDMGSSREGKSGAILSGDHPHLYGVKIPDPDQEYEIRETPVYTALSLIQKEKEAAEKKRLFYVGTTRARDHLILCGKKPDTFHESIEKSNNRIDWICTLFGITQDIAEEGGIITIDPGDGEGPIEVTVLTDPDQLTRMWAHEENPPLLLPDTYASSYGTRKQTVAGTNPIARILQPIPVTDIRMTGKRSESDEPLHQVVIPGASHLHPDEVGTLLHQIFSGKDPKLILAFYGIEGSAAESFCRSLYEQFRSVPLVRDAVQTLQEVSFVTHVGEYPVTGRIDRFICDHQHEWAVIDYKSGEMDGAELQLNLYRIAAESLTGQQVRMYLYSMKSGELYEPRYLSREEVEEQVRRYVSSS